MPIYEYRCHKCGNTFETIQKFSDEPVTVHPECGGEVERLISKSALQFKGSGWYVTDYAKSGSAAPPPKDGASSKDAKDAKDAKGGSGSETKSGETTKSDKPASSPASTPSTSSSPSSSSGSSSSGSESKNS